MKKLIASASVTLLFPALALAAAFDDVALSTGADFSVGSVTINVNSATLVDVTTDASTFDVTLAPGSSINASAPGLNKFTFSSNASPFLTSDKCSDAGSSFVLQVPSTGATTTVTVTPTSTICAAAGGSGSGGSGSGSGGGGGGGGGTTILPGATPTPAPTSTPASTSASKPKPTPAPAPAAKPSGTAGSAPSGGISFTRDLQAGSTGSDVRELQKFLNARGFVIAANGSGSPGNETITFGNATKAALAKFQASMGISPASGILGPKTRSYISGLAQSAAPAPAPAPAPTPTPRTPLSATGNFTRDLQIGSTGEDVKALQVYLNAHGFAISASGSGSPGSETTLFGKATRAALIKLQKAAGISPASGYFGPKTRAYVNAKP